MATPGRLRISRLTVRGVLGVDESTIDLDTITVLSGANASGKSSHLTALRAALGIERTSLARLAKVGAEAPAVEVLLVGDDEREVRVSRKGGESPEVRERVGQDWRKVPRPVEWLRQLIDVQGANPAAWLAMSDEDKASALLEAMPLPNYSREAALEAAGLQDFRLPPIPAGLHPLEDLEQIEAAVFSSRTEVNRQARTEGDAAERLLAGLPADPPADLGAAVADLEANAERLAQAVVKQTEAAEAEHSAAVNAAEGGLTLRAEELRGQFNTDAARLRAEHETDAAVMRANTEARIEVARKATEAAIEALRSSGADLLGEETVHRNDLVTQADRALEAAAEGLELRQRELARVREKLAALRATAEAISTDRHVRATAEDGKKLARVHEARANELTRALAALTRYKLELASALPIKGLAVVFNEAGRKSLTLEGVPLAQVNKGRLAAIAVEVSLLRGAPDVDIDRPRLPLVLLDDAEKLDDEARTALLREVAARGAQVVAAVVSTSPFRVLRGAAATEPAA